MKKNTSRINKYNDEIDLMPIFTILWNGKIKLLIITFVSFLIGLITIQYSKQSPIKNLYSLKVGLNQNLDVQYKKFDFINKILGGNETDDLKYQQNVKILSDEIKIKYLSELKDYEEFLASLKILKYEDFLTSNPKEQQAKLINYINLLKIKESEDGNSFKLNLKWSNATEAMNILEKTLNLVSQNLSKSIYEEFVLLIELQKKLQINHDKERLKYLDEQSSIAKELNIESNQTQNLSTLNSNLTLYNNINVVDDTYYLRGYKAIDKEIELIKNRDYSKFDFVEKELDFLKNKNIKWINYNIYSIETKLGQKNKTRKNYLIISILFGLVAGVIYVFISNSFRSHVKFKKPNKT